MANFFSKCFSELALMATAMLWAGCGNVDKDSKNEKSVSSASDSFGVAEVSKPAESPDSAALPHVSEKDDSVASEILKDSLDANAQTVVLLDSAAQLEVQRTRDSLMKAFFPIEWNDTEKNKYEYQNVFIQRYLFAKNRDSVRKARADLGSVMCYYGVIARPNRFGLNNGSEGRFINGPENQMLGNTNVIKLRGFVKVLYEKIESVDNLTLDQEMLFRVKRVFKQRIPGLRLIYGKFLKKNNAFQGKIVLKMAIAADGTVKESSIKKSTTGVKDFDEEIRNSVSRWTFSKVKSGTTVVYVPIHFYEDAKLSSQPK
ncbi:TonB family protein [Fibrobacter sp. UWB3]|uniref:TonB family protein n=1 Tax=Fibrobacter sp. UWB3 TaxID=1964357 RepID=UPI001C3D5A7F|nr:TonB family protein [Fibrobacter sp. UWB3]